MLPCLFVLRRKKKEYQRFPADFRIKFPKCPLMISFVPDNTPEIYHDFIIYPESSLKRAKIGLRDRIILHYNSHFHRLDIFDHSVSWLVMTMVEDNPIERRLIYRATRSRLTYLKRGIPSPILRFFFYLRVANKTTHAGIYIYTHIHTYKSTGMPTTILCDDNEPQRKRGKKS